MDKQLKKIRNKFLLILLGLILLGFAIIYVIKTYNYLQIPSNARQCLFQSSEMILYSIDPAHSFEPKKNEIAMQSFKVLGSLPIEDVNTKLALANEIKRVTSVLLPFSAACFNPRHAIRVSNQKESFDFLICFECSIIEVYQGETCIATVSITGYSDIFNDLLEKANIPLAPKP